MRILEIFAGEVHFSKLLRSEVESSTSDPSAVVDMTVVVFNALSDGDALNGRSTFLKPHSAAVAIEELGRTIRRILEVTVATEDLEHFVRNKTNGVDGEELTNSSLLSDELAHRINVVIIAEVDDGTTESVEHHLHVSKLHADSLTLDDRLTEGHTIMSTSDRHLEHALSDTQVRGSDVNTRNSEGVHRNFHALTALTKHELRIDLNVGELQTSVARTTAAHHVRHRNEFEAREAHVNEECGEALVAFFVRVSYADNVRELRAVGVGDEPLFTIEDPFALLFVPNLSIIHI